MQDLPNGGGGAPLQALALAPGHWRPSLRHCPYHAFPPGTPVSSTRKLISSSSFHRLDMTLAVAEALTPNKPNRTHALISCNNTMEYVAQ